jgi:hypothetical protein
LFENDNYNIKRKNLDELIGGFNKVNKLDNSKELEKNKKIIIEQRTEQKIDK